MKNFWYFVYLYLTIYVPVIAGSARKICILLYLLAALIIIFRNQKISAKIFNQCKVIAFAIFCLVLYVVTNVFIFHADPMILTATFSMTIVPFASVIALTTLFIAKKRTDFISDFIKVAVIASTISIILYLIPPLGKSILFLLAGDEGDSIRRFYDAGRGYGFAGSLFFGYSIVQAIAAVFAIKRKSKYKYLFVIMMLISIILNARIGLFLFIILLAIHYFTNSSIRQTIKSFIAIIIFVAIIIETGVYKEFQESLDWTLEGFYMVSDFLFNTNYTNGFGHFNGLAGSFLIWPQNIQEWVMGKGIYLLYGDKGYSSDVGLILHLQWGGLIYLFLLLCPLLFLIKKGIQHKSWWYVTIILMTLLLGDWKGDLFTQSNFLFIAIILYLLKIKKYEIDFCRYSRIQ